jgi:uridine kinase
VKSGFQVLHVELDNWLVPESLRTKEMNVYERFRLPQVESDLGRLLRGESLVLSRYRNHPDSLSIPVEYNPSGTDIIIVDGVVALSSPWLRDRSHLKLFTTVPRATFEERIIEYYSWRGKTVREIETLVQKRKRDEYQLIEKESKFADLIINPAAS